MRRQGGRGACGQLRCCSSWLKGLDGRLGGILHVWLGGWGAGGGLGAAAWWAGKGGWLGPDGMSAHNAEEWSVTASAARREVLLDQALARRRRCMPPAVSADTVVGVCRAPAVLQAAGEP